MRMGPADAPFVIGLAESYAPGWQLHGLPRGVHAEHFVIDGYANAWRLTGSLPSKSFELTAVYQPESYVQLAQRVSVAALVAGALLIGLERVRRKRRPVLRAAATKLRPIVTRWKRTTPAKRRPPSRRTAGPRRRTGPRSSSRRRSRRRRRPS
jgi:hypothetical protein